MEKMSQYLVTKQFLLPMLFIIGSLILGILAEKLIRMLLDKMAARTGRRGYQIVSRSLRFMVAPWFVIGGIYGTLLVLDLRPEISNIYNKIFLALIAFSLTIVTARVSAGFVDRYTRRGKGTFPSTTILGNVVRITIILTGLMVIMMLLNIPITPILTALGIGGFAVALAFNDTLSNLFSGLHILAARQIRPGDYVSLESGEEGYVVDVSWRNTAVRTLPDNMVIIPNSKLSSTILTNYYQPGREMATLIDVHVSYNCDLSRVEEVTCGVAREVLGEIEGGVPHFEPFIRYHTFSEYSIVFTVILRVREFVDQYLIKHEFIKRLHRRYRENGISIPMPAGTVFLRGDERTHPHQDSLVTSGSHRE